MVLSSPNANGRRTEREWRFCAVVGVWLENVFNGGIIVVVGEDFDGRWKCPGM